ncbi:MAG: flagellar export protein FliJ [Hyphomicrobiaceae bacterium]
MKSRESMLKPKRFNVTERARKVADLESMIREFEGMAAELDRQIMTEEDRTGVKDPQHFSYSTFAKAAAQRREKLLTSVADLRAQLERAASDHAIAVEELRLLETEETRDSNERSSSMRPDRPLLLATASAGRLN